MNHEDNLFDFYAGLAMLGMIMRGEPSGLIPTAAFAYAEDMLAAREEPEPEPQGIAAIHKPKRKYVRKNAD